MLIDHVILAVDDLDAAAKGLLDSHGLASVPGGRHPAWGTANRIVPMGKGYLELVAVVDPDAAASSDFGRWVGTADTAAGVLRPLGWAVRTDGLDAVCDRLGLVAVDGSRQTADGRVLQWKLAGVERAVAEPCLPFFIQWGAQTPLPGMATVRHPAGESRISRLHVTGEIEHLRSWLYGEVLPVAVRSGPSAVTAIDIASAGRVLVLGQEPS